jgi:LacI family transcriptional regulator
MRGYIVSAKTRQVASKPVTMAEIAAACQVSRTTVSRVLNNDPRVKAATREKVLRAAKKMEYRPNLAALGLRKGRTYFVGIVIDSMTEETARMVAAIEKRCREHGYHIALCIADNDRSVAADWIETNNYLEGIIFLRSGIHKVVWDRVTQMPSIYAYCLPDEGTENCIFPDNIQGATLAVKHLIELGHRRIAFINGPPEWEAHVTRLQGWRNALAEIGIVPLPQWLEQGDGSHQSGYEVAHALLTRVDPRPTALFVCNDRMAVGALQAAQALGFKVPDDLSIMGYEDKELSHYTIPALSTVRLPLEEVADLATYRLLASLTSRRTESWPLLKVNCDVVLRASTGAPPSTD